VTALDALAIREAKVQYDRARRAHQKALLEGTAQPLSHTFAYRRIVRFGPSETLVVREIG
jgi:hypothetical protein